MATFEINSTANRAAECEAFVISRLSGRVQCFQIVVMADGVILRGKAPSYHAKQTAQHLVIKTSTLQILANEIEVANGDA